MKIYTIYLNTSFWRRVEASHIEIVGDKTYLMDEKLIVAVVPPQAMVIQDKYEIKFPHNKY